MDPSRNTPVFFYTLPVPCITIGRDGYLQQINDKAAQVLQIRLPLSEQLPLKKFLALKDQDRFDGFLSQLFSSPKPHIQCEIDLQSGTGQITHIQLEASRCPGQACCILVLLDITPRKQAEEQLKSRERMLSAGARLAKLGCWRWNRLQDHFLPSDAFLNLHGCVTPKRSLTELASLVHPEDRLVVQQAFQTATQTGEPYEIEHRILREDTGELRHVRAYGEPVHDEQGQLTALFGTCQDITEFKLAQEALRLSEEKYRQIHESITDAYVMVDMEGRIIESNHAYQTMLGYSAQELKSMTFLDLTPEKWHEFELGMLKDVILPRGYSEVYQKEYRRKDGTIFPVELRVLMIRNHEGQGECMWALIRDITQRKHAETKLKESEERFRKIAEIAPVPLVITRISDATFQYANPLAASLVGLTPEQMVGMSATEFYADPTTRAPFLEAVVRQGQVRLTEMAFKKADGTPFWGLTSSARETLQDEDVILSAVYDITDRKQAEEALRKSEQRYRALVTASAQIVWKTDPAGNILEISPTWFELTGQNEADLAQWRWLKALYPEDFMQVKTTLLNAYQQGKPFQTEYRVQTVGGEIRHLRAYGIPIFEPDLGIQEWVGASSDETEYKTVSNALRESEAHLKSLTESVPAILFSATPEGTVTYASQAYYEMTGLTPDSLESGEWVKMVHPEDREWLVSIWQKSFSLGYAPPLEYRVLLADGGFRWVKGEVEPVRDNKGKILKWYGSIVDIHELKQLQMELEERDKQKDEFLSVLAHELKNPLAPILIAAQLLESKGLSDLELFQWAVGAIRHEAKHMSQLVNELLDVARVTQGKILLKKTRFDLCKLIVKKLETFRLMGEEKARRFHLQLPAVPVSIEADQNRIEQILANLINNAMKYTEQGGNVWISLETDNRIAVLRVQDDGLGIAESQLAGVFALFSQFHIGTEKGESGLGIGLALTKGLVDTHGGQIEAKSEGAGLGSEFIVRLPMVTSDYPALLSNPGYFVKEPSLEGKPRLKVLVVDTQEAMREAVVWLAANLGCEVLEAESCEQALKLAQAEDLDIIFIDLGLTDGEGYVFAEQVKTLCPSRMPRLVAVSSPQHNPAGSAVAKGFDLLAQKPLDLLILEKILKDLA